jgi:hypothetical protein
MTRKLDRNSPSRQLATLPLKRATMQIDALAKTAIGGVSLEFVGRHNRSVQLRFLAKSTKPVHRIGTITFEISRVQAWALAEWIIEESTKHAPLS